jgi:hypothetical protein
MYQKIFLSLFILLLIATPVFAQSLNWQPVNYSNPETISQSGLTVEEFNKLTQEDWLELLDNKEKINFAFSATNETGVDITSSINPDLSINIDGMDSNQIVQFEKIEESTEKAEEENETLNETQIKINNSELNFTKVLYVDSINGSDITGDGSLENPYKTLDKIAGLSDKTFDAIKLAEGTYYINKNYMSDYKNGELSIIGENQKTKLVFQPAYSRFMFDGIGGNGYFAVDNATDIYNLIVENKGANAYANYFYIYGNLNVYNVVFDNLYQVQYRTFFSKTGVTNFYNSMFLDNDQRNWFNGTETSIINSYGNYSYYGDKPGLIKTSIFETPNIDSSYNINSNNWQNAGTGENPDGTRANIGIYGGQYSW